MIILPVVGNKYFREAVARSLEEYMLKQSRFEKSLVVQNIVDEIHCRGGRFLKQDSRTGRYTIELTMTQSREKVGHAIRDASNLYNAKQNLPRRPPPLPFPEQQQQQQQQEQGRSVLTRIDAPPFEAAAADRQTASGKRRRPKQPQQQQQYPQDVLGSSSSSTLSMVGDISNSNNNMNASPLSARGSLSFHNPIVLPFPSPIDYSSIIPQQQQQQQQQGQSYFSMDPLSPNMANTTMYRFDPLDGTAAFSTQQISQPTTLYQMDPQMYNRRQQMFQQPPFPRQQQQQQQQQQQVQSGSDPVYINYPSQQLIMHSMPVASQQQPPPQSTRQSTAETRSTQVQQPVAAQGTTPLPPQHWTPYKRPSLDFTEYVNQDDRPDVGISSFDSYTQMLFQEQQERFYREYQMGLNRPSNIQALPRQLQNDDYFLEAIDSVLGPMDPDNNNNNNSHHHHSDNDELPTQPSDLPDSVSDGTTALERQGSRIQNVGRRDETSPRPDDSLEEHKRTSSIDPSSSSSSTNRFGRSE